MNEQVANFGLYLHKFLGLMRADIHIVLDRCGSGIHLNIMHPNYIWSNDLRMNGFY